MVRCIKMNILFWNIKGNGIADYVTRCALENDANVICLAEHQGVRPDELCKLLGSQYRWVSGVNDSQKNKVTVFARYDIRQVNNGQLLEPFHRCVIWSFECEGEVYNLVALHLVDKGSEPSSDARHHDASRMMVELLRRENQSGCENSIVIGDFNSDPVVKLRLALTRASREASRRAALPRRCALPAPKTFDGYDWSAVSWPEGFGRADLESLLFLEGAHDLVLMGDVGTGKTHMASALCVLACQERLEARFFTASSLVMRLRRARDEGRLDHEASQIGRARLLVVDELGFLPLDADGARLLFQVFSDAYERQSVVITTHLEFSRWGGRLRRRPDGRGGHRPGGPPRQAPAVPGRVLQGAPRAHAGIGPLKKTCPDQVSNLLKSR